MKRPNLFIIGAPKSGTTALARYLSEHPAVYFSNPKEPFFLADDFPIPPGEYNLESLDDYLRLFSSADPKIHKIVAEGSTNYLRSKSAVQNALKLSEDARFICLLRSPVELAHAFHMEQVWCRNEDVLEFEAAWKLQDRRRQGECIPRSCRDPEFLQYREIAALGDQLRRFTEIVPPEQRLLLFHEEFRANTLITYRKVLSFLGIEHDGRTEFQHINAAKVHRYPWIANFALSPPAFIRPLVDRVRLYQNRNRFALIEGIKKNLRVERSRSQLNEEFEHVLKCEMSGQVTKIEEITRENLDHWR